MWEVHTRKGQTTIPKRKHIKLWNHDKYFKGCDSNQPTCNVASLNSSRTHHLVAEHKGDLSACSPETHLGLSGEGLGLRGGGVRGTAGFGAMLAAGRRPWMMCFCTKEPQNKLNNNKKYLKSKPEQVIGVRNHLGSATTPAWAWEGHLHCHPGTKPHQEARSSPCYPLTPPGQASIPPRECHCSCP